jgi:hypothetical protein
MPPFLWVTTEQFDMYREFKLIHRREFWESDPGPKNESLLS